MAGKPKKHFQKRLTINSLRTLQWALSALPRWFSQGCIKCLFVVVYPGLGRLREVCQKNLRMVYGQSKGQREYDDMTRKNIRHISRSMMDMLYYVERPDALAKVVEITGEQHLKDALKNNKGVIAVTAHMGNFPLMFESLINRGYKVNVIIRPMRDENFGQFMKDLCLKWNINMIQTAPRKTFFKDSLRALRNNEMLFILLDEAVTKEVGVPVKFFDEFVYRATGPMLFHERVGSPIVPIFNYKDELGQFIIQIEESLQIEKQLSDDDNVVANITALTQIIERYVKQNPVQWAGWLNKRWFAR